MESSYAPSVIGGLHSKEADIHLKVKLGDFLIPAQMPEPQPGWCQQYHFDLVPIWARKFEPPALTGWEMCCDDHKNA